MAQTRYCEVVFGIGALGTVGYRLFDPDGAANGPRIAFGITERGTNTGIYGALVTLPDNFDGEIRWDTGDAEPIYASEDIHMAAPPVTMNAEIIENPSTGSALEIQVIENVDAPVLMNVEIIENV